METSEELAQAMSTQLSNIQLPNGSGVLHIRRLSGSIPLEQALETHLRPNFPPRPPPAQAFRAPVHHPAAHPSAHPSTHPSTHPSAHPVPHQVPHPAPHPVPHQPPQARPIDVRPPVEQRLCRLELENFFDLEEFDVVGALVGVENRNIAFLMEQAGCRVDIGVKGVPHQDAPTSERLHIIIKSLDSEAYRVAVEMAEDLLQSIMDDYDQAHQQSRKTPARCSVKRHEYVETETDVRYIGCTRRL
ncbi:MAG: hypothetical protein KVP17_002577 [Porospora cf. gigantea B]|nr:MAG: hypothetical protein KVP17_002577 [Porospora cf. gigantea B]